MHQHASTCINMHQHALQNQQGRRGLDCLPLDAPSIFWSTHYERQATNAILSLKISENLRLKSGFHAYSLIMGRSKNWRCVFVWGPANNPRFLKIQRFQNVLFLMCFQIRSCKSGPFSAVWTATMFSKVAFCRELKAEKLSLISKRKLPLKFSRSQYFPLILVFYLARARARPPTVAGAGSAHFS